MSILELKIEKGVPINPQLNRGWIRRLFEQMEPGDSVVVNDAQVERIRQYAATHPLLRIMTRKISGLGSIWVDGKYRVWVIKKPDGWFRKKKRPAAQSASATCYIPPMHVPVGCPLFAVESVTIEQQPAYETAATPK